MNPEGQPVSLPAQIAARRWHLPRSIDPLHRSTPPVDETSRPGILTRRDDDLRRAVPRSAARPIRNDPREGQLMYKVRIRRRRRSGRPLPDLRAPRAAGFDPQAPRLLQRYLVPVRGRRDLKIAGSFALVAHFLLFFVVIPHAEVTPIRIEEVRVVTVLTPLPLAAPSPPERPRARSKTRISIPDPTPRDPEPIYYTHWDTIESGEAEAEFPVGLPDAPPGPPGARGNAVHAGESGLLLPQLLQKVVPDYPASATRAGIQGRVHIEAVITVEGTVVEPKLLRGLRDDELNRRALAAVLQWTFEPGVRDGRPVSVIATFTIDFSIH